MRTGSGATMTASSTFCCTRCLGVIVSGRSVSCKVCPFVFGTCARVPNWHSTVVEGNAGPPIYSVWSHDVEPPTGGWRPIDRESAPPPDVSVIIESMHILEVRQVPAAFQANRLLLFDLVRFRMSIRISMVNIPIAAMLGRTSFYSFPVACCGQRSFGCAKNLNSRKRSYSE